jgi:hypothetical protein
MSPFLSVISGVMSPRVADGGDGIQIRKVAANVLNKQLRTVEN